MRARALGLVARIDLDARRLELGRDVAVQHELQARPSGPFTLTVWPSTLAVTPDGIGTGFFRHETWRLFHFVSAS